MDTAKLAMVFLFIDNENEIKCLVVSGHFKFMVIVCEHIIVFSCKHCRKMLFMLYLEILLLA